MTEGPAPRRRAAKKAAPADASAAPPSVPHPPPSETPPSETPLAKTTPAKTTPLRRRTKAAAASTPPPEPPSVPPPTAGSGQPVDAGAAAAGHGETGPGEADHGDAGHGAGAEHGGGSESGRLRTVMAVLIAMISVTGALVTWRAEVAGSEAGRADREGTIVAVVAQGARQQAEAQARAEARAAQRAYEAYAASQIYRDIRDAATDQQAYDEANRRFLQEDGVAVKLTDGYFVLDFVKHDAFGYPTDPAYDVNKRIDDLLAQGQTESDSGRFFHEADQLESTRSKLFALDVMLVVALALIAIGQVTRRRRTALSFAGPGLVLFIVATALFAVVEA